MSISKLSITIAIVIGLVYFLNKSISYLRRSRNKKDFKYGKFINKVCVTHHLVINTRYKLPPYVTLSGNMAASCRITHLVDGMFGSIYEHSWKFYGGMMSSNSDLELVAYKIQLLYDK